MQNIWLLILIWIIAKIGSRHSVCGKAMQLVNFRRSPDDGYGYTETRSDIVYNGYCSYLAEIWTVLNRRNMTLK